MNAYLLEKILHYCDIESIELIKIIFPNYHRVIKQATCNLIEQRIAWKYKMDNTFTKSGQFAYNTKKFWIGFSYPSLNNYYTTAMFNGLSILEIALYGYPEYQISPVPYDNYKKYNRYKPIECILGIDLSYVLLFPELRVSDLVSTFRNKKHIIISYMFNI
jgi:hypothetical protein